jgi:dihydrofolate reductase
MNFIVAIDENNGIGKDNDLLIKIEHDLKHFKSITSSHNVVMGRVTFQSLPKQKPLPNRTNIILTKDDSFKVENAVITNSVNEVLEYAQKSQKDTFIIGGEKIYELFMPYCNKAYITKIFHTFNADKFLIGFDSERDWKLIDESEIFLTESNIKYQFLVFERQCVQLRKPLASVES